MSWDSTSSNEREDQPFVSERVNRLARKPDAGERPVRFDERGVEPGHGRDDGTPADERAGQQGKTSPIFVTAQLSYFTPNRGHVDTQDSLDFQGL